MTADSGQVRVLPVFAFDIGSSWLLDRASAARGADWFSAQMVSAEASTARMGWRQAYVHEPRIEDQLHRARQGYAIVADSLVVETNDEAANGWQTGTQVFGVVGGWTVAQTVLTVELPELGGIVEITVALSASDAEFDSVSEDYSHLVETIRLGESILPVNAMLAGEWPED